MKHTSKHNAGFTLIELVVAMAIAVVVTAAATSVLLMGLRINRQTGDTASQQITVRSLLTTVEDIVAEGNISKIEMNTESWRITDNNDRVVLSYQYDEVEKKGTIYVGDYAYLQDQDDETIATPVLPGLLSSYVELYDGLFSIYVETEDGMYNSSVYCRSMETNPENNVTNGDGFLTEGSGDDAKTKFLNALKSQYRSRGEILVDGVDFGEYYSEWYIDLDYDDGIYDNGWNADTPWCACYISWALVQGNVNSPIAGKPRWYANVDDFMDFFDTEKTGDYGQSWLPGGSTPQAGDLIFFDWNKKTNPQHMGVVLKVENNMIYTIEGNSAGRVTVRTYSLTDARIIGYGVLWP